jgi:hypothetical protein
MVSGGNTRMERSAVGQSSWITENRHRFRRLLVVTNKKWSFRILGANGRPSAYGRS